MLKYKKGLDPCPHPKPIKNPQVTSVNSNKSLLKFSTQTQQKSTSSVQMTDPANHNKSYQKTKPSKHLESHTFATNTHQNSVNGYLQSTSHNNSKSNKKSSNLGKKSNGKKVVKQNESSKVNDLGHGRSVSHYQNLSFVVKNGKDKTEIAKNYKNVLKARKEQKQPNQITQNNKQPRESIVYHANQQPQLSKPRIKANTSQLTKKSINISSLKQLKHQRQDSKSHSKSKEFQKYSKKSHNSKKHLMTEISHTITVKENNINHGNSKSVTRRNDKDQLNTNANKLGSKKRNISSASQLLTNQALGFESRQNNARAPRHKVTQIEEYEKVPLHIFKSSTNSDIEYSNIDENTVKSIVKKRMVSGLQEPFFYNQDDEIVFCKDSEDEEIVTNERIRGRMGNEGERKFGKMGKKYSKVNLQLSSECFNCMTEPDYLVQPKGIRHLFTAYPSNEQPYAMKSYKQKQSSSSRRVDQSRNQAWLYGRRPQLERKELQRRSAIKIQKVWRGHMTRKLLAVYIAEEEEKLQKRMKEFGRGNGRQDEEVERVQYNSVSSVFRVDNVSYKDGEWEADFIDDNDSKGELDESSIPAQRQQQIQHDQQSDKYKQQSYKQKLRQQSWQPGHINNSLNTLDYESQILPRQDQTISFLGEINNINLKGYSLIENDLDNGDRLNVQASEVVYTEVESGGEQQDGSQQVSQAIGIEGDRHIDTEGDRDFEIESDHDFDIESDHNFVEESRDQFGDKLVNQIQGYHFPDRNKQQFSNPIDKSSSYSVSYEAGAQNQSYQIDNTLVSEKSSQNRHQPRLFSVNESQSYQDASEQQPSQSSQQEPYHKPVTQQRSYQEQQSSYQDPTTFLAAADSKSINEPNSKTINEPKFMQSQSSETNPNYNSYAIDDEASSYLSQKKQGVKMSQEQASYRIDNESRWRNESCENAVEDSQDRYQQDSLQLPDEPSAIMEQSINQIQHAELQDQSYIPDTYTSQMGQLLDRPYAGNEQTISKSYSDHLYHELSQTNNDQSQYLNQQSQGFILKEEARERDQKGERDQSFKLPHDQHAQIVQQMNINNLDEDSYQIEEQDLSDIQQFEAIQSALEPSMLNFPQTAINKPPLTSKSNPNIVLAKSPKNASFFKPFFPQPNPPITFSNQLDQQTQSQQTQKEPSNKASSLKQITEKQLTKKSSSLKQIFMKKSFFTDNPNFLLNHQTNISIPALTSSPPNYLPYPTQKQAGSIQSLLHFRHQCLTQHHSSQFHNLQSQYVHQKITKQQFISQLRELASQFESSAVSIKQTQKDIFNGYKALLKLIKDVVKDCKVLGLSEENGTNVRFCRSMEFFVGEKSLLKGNKQQGCVFGDEYLWKFDDVMIDEMERSKKRSNQASAKKELGNSQAEARQKEEQKAEKAEIQVKRVPEKQQAVSLSQSHSSKSSSIFSSSANQPRHIPFPVESKPLMTSPAVSSSSSQKQLSRQSLSHHHLPQLILDGKEVSPDKPLSISRGQLSIKQITEGNDLAIVEGIVQKQSEREVRISHPCSFDISQLGECEDEYIDDDEDSHFSHPHHEQKRLVHSAHHSNDSSSYNIDNDYQQAEFQENEQRHVSEENHASRLENQTVKKYHISEMELKMEAEGYVSSPKVSTVSPVKVILNKHSATGNSQLTLIINHKNQQFSQNQHQVQDLLNNDPEEHQQKHLQQSEMPSQVNPVQSDSSDSLEPQPLIKREVYQLSCDSDSDQDQEETTMPNGLTQVQTQKQSNLKSLKLVQTQNFLHRTGSFDCSQPYKQYPQNTTLSAKYDRVAEFVTIMAIWQVIEEITLNKAKHTAAKHPTMGKRLADSAKFHSDSISKECFSVLPFNDSQQETTSNVVIITNRIKNRRPKQNVKRQEPVQRQQMGRIREDEIREFLGLMSREMPLYEESRQKLMQRMYPNPVELLTSLRDTQMQLYFGGTHSHNRGKEPTTSPRNQLERNHNQLESNHNQLEGNQRNSPSHSSSSSCQGDSQTSYLQLGSYEFLLSQQLCQQIIEKYISDVYEPEFQMKKRLNEMRGESGGDSLSEIKREFNEYVAVKNVLGNCATQDNPSKANDFQTLIRTRQLFCEHKQHQSQMLRKQILKIQLHTILDSMNEQIIKQRQSKTGYSGIGLNQLALGLVERTGVQVASEQQYQVLVDKAKYRLDKFVLNSEVDVNDKLILQCQQTVTMNDSLWVFYVTEALEFGLEISKIVEELMWEEVTRQISRMMIKRKFTLENKDWEVKTLAKVKDLPKQQSHLLNPNKNDTASIKQPTKPRKVISINIVVPQQQSFDPRIIHSPEQNLLQQSYSDPQNEKSFIGKEEPFDVSCNSCHDSMNQKCLLSEHLTHQNEPNDLAQNQQDNDSYQLDDEEIEFDEDEQLEKELKNMHFEEETQELETQMPHHSDEQAD